MSTVRDFSETSSGCENQSSGCSCNLTSRFAPTLLYTATGISTRPPWVSVSGRSRTTKKSLKDLKEAVPPPSAPWIVEAIIAIRQVVIESASGIEIVAAPFWAPAPALAV